MKCEKCGGPLRIDMAYTFKDRKVCDDCYIDLINRPRSSELIGKQMGLLWNERPLMTITVRGARILS